jgi:hypothetical protein
VRGRERERGLGLASTSSGGLNTKSGASLVDIRLNGKGAHLASNIKDELNLLRRCFAVSSDHTLHIWDSSIVKKTVLT